ncbi:nucleoside recognition domain-containing protein, partial [Staphylococcus pseudintermedius]|uniref:nucleoside recognition domain-containing protein n=1 Tax=Staphylococcus pseudintermedius TaxID=283734 RepID=UPI000D9CEA61
LTDGIIACVGDVLVFILKNVVLVFIISFIEDSGYMASRAVIMDRLMEKFGLNGKAFIPLISGFGCKVQVNTIARASERYKERQPTKLRLPVLSCLSVTPL